MNRTITARPLTAEAFAPFGDVLEVRGSPDKIINAGMCGRYHDVARLDFGSGRAGISIFDGKPRKMPLTLDLMERHPEGSQAFLPLTGAEFLVIVATDAGGVPSNPLAFLTKPGQGVNYHRNTWHGVLTPLHAPGLFAVVDRIGDGPNLQEHTFDVPWRVVLP